MFYCSERTKLVNCLRTVITSLTACVLQINDDDELGPDGARLSNGYLLIFSHSLIGFGDIGILK